MLKSIILSITIIALISCTVPPKPVYRLMPEAEKSAWLYGQEFIHLDNDSFDVALAYDKIWTNNFVFDIEIANKTDSIVLISPEDFYYKPVYSEEKLEKNKKFMSIFPAKPVEALDPELKILHMDLSQSAADASYSTRQGQLMGLSVLDLVFDIATIGKPTTEAEEAQEEIDDLERRLDYAENELEHENRSRNIGRIKDQWRDEALRKTSLKPGYSISGKIYFPMKYHKKGIRFTENLLFCFPLGKSSFTQVFRREEFLVGKLRN
ncbi:MAG: hypothetical protein D8M58_10125 [Calditrichaeota bacterium]|nr:MAG: hypothetical protein DWQ03_09500 [Calditrichota bacterium]MBL1205745.1 hypothetical protein [Calditrichota bacterium]NOG45573.1 hypothetical protein [Calditrichota bacterium]